MTDLTQADLYTLTAKISPATIKRFSIVHLGLTDGEIQQLQAECRENVGDMGFQCLNKWKTKENPTRQQLYAKCEEARKQGMGLPYESYSFLAQAAVGQMSQGVSQPTTGFVQYPALEDLDLNNLAIAIPSDGMATLVSALNISEGEQEDTLTKYGSTNRHYRLKILQIWSKKNNSDRKLLAQKIHKCKIMTVAQIIEYLEVKQEDLGGAAHSTGS